MRWSASDLDPGVLEVRLNFSGSNSEFWFLLRSDAHTDNKHCDWKLQEKHLKEALERGAGIIDNGDNACAMQGKWDRRADQNALLPELQGNDYLDKLVDFHAEKYAPYVDNWLVLGDGNHETAILKHHQTDLNERLREKFRTASKATPVRHHPYMSWILFRCKRVQQQKTIRVFRHHGWGGNAPVTHGVIHANRIGTWCPDAHIVIMGHNHREWMLPVARHRISKSGVPYYDEQFFLRIPGYKCEMGDGSGWAVERGFAPTSTAAAWLRIYFEYPDFKYEILRAK